MSCESCKGACEALESVPFYIYEAGMARSERTNKRLWITALILIFLLVATNAGWLVYESQFEEVVTSTTIEAEQDGAAVNIVGGGDINYGAESKGD